MSAIFLVIDTLLAAVILRMAWPMLDDQTKGLAVVCGMAVLVFRVLRY